LDRIGHNLFLYLIKGSGERENVFLSLLSKLGQINITKFKEDNVQRVNLQKKPISKTQFAQTSQVMQIMS
jgi:hypothetical protein